MLPNVKIIVIAALIIGALAFSAWVAKLKHDSDGYHAAQTALAGEQRAHKADLAKVAADLAQSQIDRQKLLTETNEITRRFREERAKVTDPKILVRTVEVPGACPHIGVSADFVSLWNNAASP